MQLSRFFKNLDYLAISCYESVVPTESFVFYEVIMSNEVIFHHVNSNHSVDELIQEFYPEFCESNKKDAIRSAIDGLNSHNGNTEGDSLSLNSWVLLPDHLSDVYHYISEQKNPRLGVCSVMASLPVFGMPNLSSKEHNVIHQGMKSLGPKKMLATGEFLHDWYHESIDNLKESPVKDTLTETTTHFLEKAGEHGTEIFMATRSLDNALKKFAKSSGKFATQEAKKEVLVAHGKLKHEIPNLIQKKMATLANSKFTSQASRRGLNAILSPGSGLRSAKKLAHSETLVISGAQYTKMIKVMKYSEHIGNGVIILDIATNTMDVVDAYQKGQDWKELAFEDSMGMTFSSGFGWAGGALGEISVGVCGPCTLVFTPTLAIGGAVIGEKVGKALAKVMYKINYD